MKQTSTILVVDDDNAHRTMLKTLISRWGYQVEEAEDGSTAVEKVEEKPFDLVLMDIRMIRVSGIEALERIKEFNPAIPVILITAYSSVETAVEALKKGAYDYLTKPLDFDKLKIILERAMEHVHLKEENRILKESLGRQFDRRSIIGHSPKMNKVLETIAQVAPTDATVLITGESGVGKELIAGAIHYNSERKKGPFVKINCGAIMETLLESELFGHEKGAFTGADKKKEGRFRQAHKGSIFLDEISEMSASMQVKLLRVLQEKEITPVGGERVIPVDVRVIAATNRELLPMIESGEFRQDLYYRLNVVEIRVPSLKERREDIPLLAIHFLGRFAEKNSKSFKGFTPRAMDRLVRYNWPGNVRELMNVIERGVVLGEGEYLDAENIPIIETHLQEEDGDAASLNDLMPLEEVEKQAIIRTLKATEGNKSLASRRLGITRRTLHQKLKKYGVME